MFLTMCQVRCLQYIAEYDLVPASKGLHFPVRQWFQIVGRCEGVSKGVSESTGKDVNQTNFWVGLMLRVKSKGKTELSGLGKLGGNRVEASDTTFGDSYI